MVDLNTITNLKCKSPGLGTKVLGWNKIPLSHLSFIKRSGIIWKRIFCSIRWVRNYHLACFKRMISRSVPNVSVINHPALVRSYRMVKINWNTYRLHNFRQNYITWHFQINSTKLFLIACNDRGRNGPIALSCTVPMITNNSHHIFGNCIAFFILFASFSLWPTSFAI